MPEPETKALSLIAAYRFATEHGLGGEVAEIRNMAIDGFDNKKSAVRRGYMVKLFEDHRLFQEFKDKHWTFGKTRAGGSKYGWYLRLREQHQSAQEGAGQVGEVNMGAESEEEEAAEQAFAFEADLRDFLANNLSVIEPGLRVYDRGGRKGVEFPVENGYIDILAEDQQEKLVVIELKLSSGRNRTVGQLLYYMGWVDQHLAPGGLCRGMIIAREITDDLIVATRRAPGVSLLQYRVSMILEHVQTASRDA